MSAVGAFLRAVCTDEVLFFIFAVLAGAAMTVATVTWLSSAARAQDAQVPQWSDVGDGLQTIHVNRVTDCYRDKASPEFVSCVSR